MPALRHILTTLVTVGLAGTLVASPASAGECYDENFDAYWCPDPTISSVSVPAVNVQTSSNPIAIPVTVTVSDPSDLLDGIEFTLMQGNAVVGSDFATTPSSSSGDTKVFRGSFTHYDWDPWGQFRVYVDGYASFADVEPSASVLTSVKAQSTATNTPSLTTINKGQAFVERGFLRRFDGSALSGQKVSIYYVPAGQTKASFAGYATTTSTGAFALTVRSWFTGSWFVSYPGSTGATSTYKGAWVRVR